MNKKRAFIGIALVFLTIACVFLGSCAGETDQNQTITGGPDDVLQDENTEVNAEDDSEEREGVVLKIEISVVGKSDAFTAQLYDNATARAFAQNLPLTLDMSAMPHEKYCYLDQGLPIDPYSPGRINVGDVMLWGNSCLVIFYESFSTSYSYTRIGRIENIEGLAKALGSGRVTLNFKLVK